MIVAGRQVVYIHTMNIHFTEFNPSNGLRHYVESYWYVNCEGPANSVSSPNYCLPKGTIDLIFSLDGPKSEIFINGKWEQLEDALVFGISTRAIMWRMKGQSSKFGIRLKPSAFLRLFNEPVTSISHNGTDIKSLNTYRYSWLISRIKNAVDNESRIAIIESFLYKKLAMAKSCHSLLLTAIRKIWEEDGNISTASLSKSVYIGERQLQRLFKNTIGVSPKLYSRIIRFRSAYKQAESGKSPGWTDVAYNLGYSDQAHFVKDFKSFAGVTPTTLFN